MKKHALGLAVLAAITVPTIALADGPTVYGKLNVTLDNVDTDTGVAATSTTNWQLNSNASRIGIKGDTETGIQNLKGLYYAEFGVKADDGVASGVSPFSQRNIYVGLKGDFGTLRAGKIDTPFKDAQGKVDQFNDLAADIQNIGAGETRADNIAYYTSPKLLDGALAINVAIIPGEGRDIDNGDGDANTGTGVEEGLTDFLSASVVYEKDAWYAALAIAQNNSGSNNIDGFADIDGATAGTQSVADLVRAVVVYKTDVIEAGFLYETADDVSSGSNKSDASWVLSGAYKADKWKFKGQYGSGEGDGGKTKTLLGIGADFAAGKNTTIYGYFASVDTDNVAPAVDTAVTTFGLGIDQKF